MSAAPSTMPWQTPKSGLGRSDGPWRFRGATTLRESTDCVYPAKGLNQKGTEKPDKKLFEQTRLGCENHRI